MREPEAQAGRLPLRIVPLSLKAANVFITEHHRHNKAVVGHKFSIGLLRGDELIGVAIAGRPVSRYLDDGMTLEITRLCVREDEPNACSKLYARVRRIAQLLGYQRVITYSLQKESGASLRAVGARCAAAVKPGSTHWKRPGQNRRYQPVYDEPKWRWHLYESRDRGSLSAA